MAEFAGESHLSERGVSIEVSNRSLFVNDGFDVTDTESRPSPKLAMETAPYKQTTKSTLLKDVAESDRVTVTWEKVDAFVPSQMVAPSALDKLQALRKRHMGSDQEVQEAFKQILYDVKGSVLPGEVLALMGPSGSGKTSVISCLGGRIPKGMNLEGQIQFNNHALNRKMKRHIGYVLQDDSLFAALTVFETLYYAARLRLPRDMSVSDKVNRVEAVVSALGLSKCRDTLIGNAQLRGVSGGERKRVSVGHELLINPSVLMLDEPTSGLDSTTAMNLLITLRELATGGRAIITTIHQPSSRLYMQLDKLILLADGHQMYSGRADLVHTWFEKLGCQLPYGVNVSDYILDLANSDFSGTLFVHSSGEEAKRYVCEACAKYLQCYEDGVKDEKDIERLQGVNPHNRKDLSGLHITQDETLMQQRRISNITSKSGLSDTTRSSGAGFFEQVAILTIRSLKTRRLEALGFQKLVQFTAIAAVAGMLWYQRGDGDTLKTATDTAGLLFFEMIFMSFSALFSALFTFPSEIGMLLKERASGMYTLLAFYIARTASDLPLDCLYPTLFIIIVYFLGGLRLTVSAFIFNWLSVIVTVLTAQSYGLLIGAAIPDLKAAQTLATVSMLTFMLTGGFWVQQIPSWIAWLKYASYIFWSYSLISKIQFRNHTYYDCKTTDTDETNDIGNIEDCEVVVDVKGALALPRDPQETALLEVGVLLAMFVVLRICIYFVLSVKTRKV